MLKTQKYVAIVAASLALVSAQAMAVVPAYVSTALNSANTTFSEYIAEAAPIVLTTVAALAGLGLIIALVRKVMRG